MLPGVKEYILNNYSLWVSQLIILSCPAWCPEESDLGTNTVTFSGEMGEEGESWGKAHCLASWLREWPEMPQLFTPEILLIVSCPYKQWTRKRRFLHSLWECKVGRWGGQTINKESNKLVMTTQKENKNGIVTEVQECWADEWGVWSWGTMLGCLVREAPLRRWHLDWGALESQPSARRRSRGKARIKSCELGTDWWLGSRDLADGGNWAC